MIEIEKVEKYVDDFTQWAIEFLPNIIAAVLILFIGLWVVKMINKLVRKFFEKQEFDLALEHFLQSFISIALKFLLFVLVITQLGVQSSSLVAIVGAAGLAVGLALQGSLANFAGGVLGT